MENRESLYDISWKVTEKEYRGSTAYSYSIISRFNREGFDGLSNLFSEIDSSSLRFGSIVDTLITGTKEEFDSRFLVAKFPQISDTLILITKELFNKYHNSHRCLSTIPDDILKRVGAKYEYYSNSRYDSYRAKQIREKCEEYYKLLFLSSGKTLISSSDYNDALDCVDILKNSPSTKFLFEANNPFDKDIERFYQLKFKGDFEGIPLRCMADLLIVDHKRREIIPCDLKTSFKKEWRFYKSFIEWGYWIQAQLYWYIIRQNLDKSETYKDYKLLDYRFIVVSNNSRKPLVWDYRDTKVITDCVYGKSKQYECKNWRNIVKELDFYMIYKPDFPIGINKVNTNDIIEWLNNE